MTKSEYLQNPWCPIKSSSLATFFYCNFFGPSIHLHGHWWWVVVAATAVIFNQICYGNKLTNKLLYQFIRIISVSHGGKLVFNLISKWIDGIWKDFGFFFLLVSYSFVGLLRSNWLCYNKKFKWIFKYFKW